MSTRTRRQDLRRAAGYNDKLRSGSAVSSSARPAAVSPRKSCKKNTTRIKSKPTVVLDPAPLPRPSPLAQAKHPSEITNFGCPSLAQYTRIEEEYLASLSDKKREKALLNQETFDMVWDVLHDPTAARIGTPQFRWWVRKMFVLSFAQTDGDSDADLNPVVIHGGRPVALKSQIYDVLCYCHQRANHGGRDRTTAVVREHYSWIPKELVAQFVRACPTCIYKKTGTLNLALQAQSHSSSVSQPIYAHPDRLGVSAVSAASTSVEPQARLYPANWTSDLAPHGSVRSRSSSQLSQPICALGPRLGLPRPALAHVPYDAFSTRPPTDTFNSGSTWMSQLTSQPGPNNAAYAHPGPAMRRIQSQNDAEYPRSGPKAGGVMLPPLMRGLSEGILGMQTPVLRPFLDVPDGPLSRFTRQDWDDGDMVEDAMDVDEGCEEASQKQIEYEPEIDPALLLEDVNPVYSLRPQPGPVVIVAGDDGTYAASGVAGADGADRDSDKDIQALMCDRTPKSTFAALRRSPQLSAATFVRSRSSAVDVPAVHDHNLPGQHNDLYDSQDWESTYCMDEM